MCGLVYGFFSHMTVNGLRYGLRTEIWFDVRIWVILGLRVGLGYELVVGMGYALIDG